jgi:hypothetical protein
MENKDEDVVQLNFNGCTFADRLAALGGIREARVSREYQLLQDELHNMHEACVPTLDPVSLLSIPSKEMKARMELLCTYRDAQSKSASALTKVEGLTEYSQILHDLCPDFVAGEVVADANDTLIIRVPGSEEATEAVNIQAVDGVDAALLEKRRVRAQQAADISAQRTHDRQLREARAENEALLAAKAVQAPVVPSPELAQLLAENARLKGMDPTRGPAENAHGDKAGRPARIADLLDRAHERLGLDGNQRSSILDFMNNPVCGVGGVHGPLSLLLPNVDPRASNPAMLAVELVRGVMLTRSQNKRLQSYEDFALQMKRAIRAAREDDPSMAVLLANHLYEVTNLYSTHSWKVAEDYHYHVMLRVEDGEWDLAHGPDTYTLTKVLHVRSKTTGGGGGDAGKSKSKGKTTSNYDKSKAKFCNFHGYCSHVTRDCEGKFKDGERAKNYRAEP